MSEEDGNASHDEKSDVGKEQLKPELTEDQGLEFTREKWANEPIAGLCVSKNGLLFATMTKSSLAIWQTKVGYFNNHIASSID